MTRKIYRFLEQFTGAIRAVACLVAAAMTVVLGQAQTLVIPQIADGGAWQTTLVLTNTSASATSVSLNFFQETSEGATQNWNLPFLEVASTQNLSLPAAGTLFLHTPGTASGTSVGWAQLQASAAVVAYAIFTQRIPGRTDQDGTAPATSSSSRILIPFDNTNGFVTSIAIANPTGASESISVGIQPSSGSSSQLSPITLPAQGHTAFALPQQFSASTGQSGLLEFYTASGSLSALALRFNPTGGFTAAPAYAESGPPIIGPGAAPPGGGTLPAFSEAIMVSANVNSGNPGSMEITIFPSGSILGCTLNGGTPGVKFLFVASWSSYTANGLTITCSGFSPTNSIVEDSQGDQAQFTSASLTLTLNPQVINTSGTVTGSINLVSTLATISGPLTGTYTAQ
jgi:hypothetical protein